MVRIVLNALQHIGDAHSRDDLTYRKSVGRGFILSNVRFRHRAEEVMVVAQAVLICTGQEYAEEVPLAGQNGVEVEIVGRSVRRDEVADRSVAVAREIDEA